VPYLLDIIKKSSPNIKSRKRLQKDTMMMMLLTFQTFLSSLFIAVNAQNTLAFVPAMTSLLSPSLPRRSLLKERSSRLQAISNPYPPSASSFDTGGDNDDDYVRNLEEKLIHLSKIVDDDVRRTDFEAWVTYRLQQELAITKSTVEHVRLKLKSLDFVKAMDRSILKLGQSAQDHGWESHVTSGFQPVQAGSNDIWPYIDMLIQFKLLLSTMERTAKRKSNSITNDITTAATSTTEEEKKKLP